MTSGQAFGFLSDPGYYVFSVFISVYVFVAIKIKFKPMSPRKSVCRHTRRIASQFIDIFSGPFVESFASDSPSNVPWGLNLGTAAAKYAKIHICVLQSVSCTPGDLWSRVIM